MTTLRDAAHLRWRFDDAPVADDGLMPFQHLQLFEGETLVAWFATRLDGHILHVHDFWSRHGAQIAPDMVAALLRAARKAGHASVSIELATSAKRMQPWLDTGFSERGKRPVFGYWGAKDEEAMPSLHLVSADEDE
jgi:hypothetical protein